VKGTWVNPNEPGEFKAAPDESVPAPGPHVTDAGGDSSAKSAPALREEDLSGDAELDARLAEPVLQGYRGIETAQVVMSAFLIIVVGLLTYSNSLGGDFIGLDRYIVVENEALHYLPRLPEALHSGAPGPVATAALSVNWMLTPDSPTGFKVFHIILHVFNGVLIYLVARRVLAGRASEAVAMVAGLVFVVLPAAAEGIHLFVARGQLLATCFALLALVAVQRALHAPDGPSARLMMLSIVFHVLAAGSSAAAILVPFVTVGYIWLLQGTLGWRRWLPWSAGLLVLMLAMVIAYVVSSGRLPGRLIAAPSFMLMAVLESVLPYHLSVMHGLPFFSYIATFGVLFFGSCFVAALLILRRRLALPLLWFGTLSVAVAVTTPPGALLAGHRFYLPLAGLAIVVPWLLVRLPRGGVRVAAGTALAVGILGAGWVTLQRNLVWKDPVALWEEAVALHPEAFEAYHELGRLYLLEGHAMAAVATHHGIDPTTGRPTLDGAALHDEAVDRYRAATELLARAAALGDPHPEVHLHRAEAHRRLGDEDAALAAYLAALAHDSEYFEAALQMAALLEAKVSQSGEHADAVRALQYYERAYELGVMPPDRLARFGMLLASIGRFEEAAAVLAEAVGGQEVSPYAQALQNVQGTVEQLRRLDARMVELMRESPRQPEPLRVRAQALLIRGHYLEAAYVLERLLRDYPGNYGGWLFLGLARAKMGAAAQFLDDHGAAPAPPRPAVSPWRDLAERAAGSDAWEAAGLYLSQDPAFDDVRAMLEVAGWALDQGRLPAAAQALGRARELDPEDAGVWLREADLALRQGQPAAAQAALEGAAQRGADAADIEAREEQLRQQQPGFTPAPAQVPGDN
jgi:tetratricopeptide (TPR) repeat protein